MNKKAAAACAVTAVAVFAAAWVARGAYDTYFVNGTLTAKLSGVQTVLKSNFLYDYDEEKAADYAALGLSMALDDPYTVYYSKDQFETYMNSGSGDFVGIGVTVVMDKEKDEIRVVSVQDDAPGFEAGILPNDILVAVDGQRYSGTQMNEAVAKIKGGGMENAENTSVVLTIRRNGEERDVTVTRRKVHEKTVKYEMLGNDVGYIRISSFNRSSAPDEKSTSEEFTEALSDLMSEDMQKLVIDVRDNGGGDLDEVTAIADMLVPEGVITYTEDKNGNGDKVMSDANELDIPMAVLVNGNTASAAELLTGALRDYEKAEVIGTTTFGKGIMQRIYPLSDGSGIVVTVARYFTPGGTCVHGTGITPDIEVEPISGYEQTPVVSIEKDKDIQLQKALDVLAAE